MSLTIKSIRNIALVSHQGAGKTTLAEAMLYSAKVVNRMGRIEDENTVMDHEQEEKSRKSSIHLAIGNFTWKDKKINILDTPGFMDFISETIAAVRVVEGVVVVLDGSSGVEVGTEIIWDKLNENNLPRMVFVNQIGKDNSNFNQCLESLKESFPGVIFTPFSLPIGQAADFKGVIDLISKNAYSYQNNEPQQMDIPDDLKEQVDQYYNAIVESATEADEKLMDKYLADEQLTEQEISEGLVESFKQNLFVPVLVGDASHNAGVNILCDNMVRIFPSPDTKYPYTVKKVNDEQTVELNADSPFCGLVFKMASELHVGELIYLRNFSGNLKSGMEVFNSRTGKTEKISSIFSVNGKERNDIGELTAGDIGVLVKLKDTKTNDTLSDKSLGAVVDIIQFPEPTVSLAVIPESKSDEEKMISGLSKVQDEDHSFKYYYDSETRQTLVEGLGEQHLEVIMAKMRNNGINLKFERPIIKYRETIRKKAEAQGKHKKQSGGRGQFADVWIRFEPLERGKDFQFENAIFGGAVPRNYIPAVEKGLKEARKKGVLSHSLTTDFKATIYDGSYHKVDSSDFAFQIAASLAFQKAIPLADPILLEPIVEVEVTVPSDYTGDVMGDISTRRGKVLGMEPAGKTQKIKAHVPEAEMYGYSTTLRSMTQGRGFFKLKYSHYEEVPREIMNKVAEETKARKEEIGE